MTSSGWSRWAYIHVPDWVGSSEDELRNFFEEQEDVPTWSEHYRKVEWKRLKKLPLKVIEENKDHAKERIKFWREMLRKLDKIESTPIDINEVEKKRQKNKINKIYKEKGLLHLIKK